MKKIISYSSCLIHHIICIGVALLLHTSIFSQEPSYARIGEEELAGLDIYSIIQDDDGYIWLSTDRDLIKYDGYNFQDITNNISGSRSLFGLKKDNDGKIFCFSLGGEIFTVKNDSLQLYYAVPDSLHNIEQSIFFDEKNNLTVCGKHLFRITPELKLELIYDLNGRPASTITGIRTPDGKNMIGGISGNYISYLIEGQLHPQVIAKGHTGGFLPITNGKATYLHINNEFQLYQQINNNFFPVPIDRHKIPANTLAGRVFILSDDIIFISTRAGGMYAFKNSGEPLYNGNKILPSYFISGFMEDREGNYWFTTLGKGLIYVTNPKIFSFQEHPILKNEVITAVCSGAYGDLFIGCESGSIIKKNAQDEVEYIISNLGKKVTLLRYFSDKNTLVLENSEGLIFFDPYEKKILHSIQKTGSVKDIFPTWNNHWLIATSYGISPVINPSSTISFNRRISQLYLNPNDSNVWIISPTGLYLVRKNSTIERLNTYGSFPIDIDGGENQIWIATSENGIVSVKGQQITQHLTLSNGLLSQQLRKIIVRENYLFITHDLGLQIYDVVKNSFINIDMSDGLLSNYIIDLEYNDDLISIVTQKGIQQLRLSDIKKNTTKPLIKIVSVKIDNTLTTPSNFIHSGKYNAPFEIFFTAGAYQHRGKLKYVYRLRGRSDNWDTTSFIQNHVKYESLSPGKYTFEVKAVNENNISSNIISYEYTVIPPVWQRWWFYTIFFILVLLVVAFIYKQQVNRIQKKNQQKNELISSRLTALKSQMNPHFIFNSLNSIQDLVLQQETEKSYDYIVKFSDLVRQTLNYSDKDFIDFEDELKLLNVYLELEQLRFQDKFKYSIEKVNIEEIEVPPMLVQPFVENAIKHGLLHKRGDKELTIVFEQTDVLTCTITDNGVGRDKAREIKERQHKAHESFSVQAIKSRFEIMQDLYKSSLGVEYVDLYENEAPIGTKVVLRLPFKPKY